MRFEYIPDASADAPLLRIVEFTAAELETLIAAFAQLASPGAEALHLTDPSAALQVVAETIAGDAGLRRTDGDTFRWSLSPNAWSDVAARAQQLVAAQGSFQWLDESGQISVLLSRSGMW